MHFAPRLDAMYMCFRDANRKTCRLLPVIIATLLGWVHINRCGYNCLIGSKLWSLYIILIGGAQADVNFLIYLGGEMTCYTQRRPAIVRDGNRPSPAEHDTWIPTLQLRHSLKTPTSPLEDSRLPRLQGLLVISLCHGPDRSKIIIC